MEPLNMHGHANTWEEELHEVCAERDALRAERDALISEFGDFKNQQREDRSKLYVERDALRAEIEAIRPREREAMTRSENADYTDTMFIRQLIDQYQGTCCPLNRTSIRALLDALEVSRAENERLKFATDWADLDALRVEVEEEHELNRKAMAEVERLKNDNETLKMLQRNQAERIDFEVARVERLRAALDGTAEACQEFKDENEQLKAGLSDALAAIDQMMTARQPLLDAWFVRRDELIGRARGALSIAKDVR